MSHPLEKTKSLKNKKLLYLFALSCRSLKSSFESNAPSAVSHHPHSEDIVAVQPQPCERVRINDSLTLFTLVEARYPKTMNFSGQAPWTQIREANSPPVGKIGRYKWKTHGFPIHDCLRLWRRLSTVPQMGVNDSEFYPYESFQWRYLNMDGL